jgi:hypothetical protein
MGGHQLLQGAVALLPGLPPVDDIPRVPRPSGHVEELTVREFPAVCVVGRFVVLLLVTPFALTICTNAMVSS